MDASAKLNWSHLRCQLWLQALLDSGSELQQNTCVFSQPCPIISDVKVSLSHLSHCVTNELAGFILSEGDPARVSVLIILSEKGTIFQSVGWEQKEI